VSEAIAFGSYRAAIDTLKVMRESGEQVALGSMQRWVRELDA